MIYIEDLDETTVFHVISSSVKAAQSEARRLKGLANARTKGVSFSVVIHVDGYPDKTWVPLEECGEWSWLTA